MPTIEKEVLVLNRHYCPLRIVTARRAFELLVAEKAVVIEKAVVLDPTSAFAEWTWADWSEVRPAEGEPFMAGVQAVYRIPTTVRLLTTERLPFGKVVFNRARLYQRDRYTCQYCGKQPGSTGLNLDHVIPVAQGGKRTWENIVAACIDCNTRKADRTPEQAGMKLRRQPKKPRHTILKKDIRVKDWETFMGEAYWLTELYSD